MKNPILKAIVCLALILTVFSCKTHQKVVATKTPPPAAAASTPAPTHSNDWRTGRAPDLSNTEKPPEEVALTLDTLAFNKAKLMCRKLKLERQAYTHGEKPDPKEYQSLLDAIAEIDKKLNPLMQQPSAKSYFQLKYNRYMNGC